MLNVEHVAWQVEDPEAVAAWYVDHLGFRVVRKNDDPARTHFIADGAGKVVVEIYNNPAAERPDYSRQHPLLLHLAFASDDPAGSRDALLKAGCTIADELRQTPAGDTLVMMRDPFGFAIQLCKRAKPLT
ncbi:MAG TPA: VOC family protein [Tepidisphaeraceae bacterium]|nr:VOC family protein [Tepidisphaeraceae bacterium]